MPKWSYPDHQPTWRDGIYYVEIKGTDNGKPTVILSRFRPSVPLLCDGLFGYVLDGHVVMPKLAKRYKIFHDALDMIELFGEYGDLLRLTGYRRQVTNMGSAPEIDERFARIIHWAITKGKLKKESLPSILIRMPPKSWIYQDIENLCRDLNVPVKCE